MQFFLYILALCPHWDNFFDKENWALWKRFLKRINLKILFLCCGVDYESRDFWKWWSMSSHVTHYIYIYIYVYIYIMFIPVLSLLCAIHVHAVATDVSLYTSYHSHAKMTEIGNTCGKTWGQLSFRSKWARHRCVSYWLPSYYYLNKIILSEDLSENVSSVFHLYRLKLFWGFTHAQ